MFGLINSQPSHELFSTEAMSDPNSEYYKAVALEEKQRTRAFVGMSKTQQEMALILMIIGKLNLARAAKLVRNNPDKKLSQLFDLV